MKEFDVLEVTRALGVAPSTGSIIANLLNGRVNPDNCRSIEYWPITDLGAPPQGLKVLGAVASLLDDECDLRQLSSPAGESWYIDGTGGQPTLIWYKETNSFEFTVMQEK